MAVWALALSFCLSICPTQNQAFLSRAVQGGCQELLQHEQKGFLSRCFALQTKGPLPHPVLSRGAAGLFLLATPWGSLPAHLHPLLCPGPASRPAPLLGLPPFRPPICLSIRPSIL